MNGNGKIVKNLFSRLGTAHNRRQPLCLFVGLCYENRPLRLNIRNCIHYCSLKTFHSFGWLCKPLCYHTNILLYFVFYLWFPVSKNALPISPRTFLLLIISYRAVQRGILLKRKKSKIQTFYVFGICHFHYKAVTPNSFRNPLRISTFPGHAGEVTRLSQITASYGSFSMKMPPKTKM